MRKRTRISTAIPVGSSDYRHLQAKREILRAGHEERVKAISMMAFSEPQEEKPTTLPKHRHYYVMCWGKRQYITYEEAVAYTEAQSVPVYWE